MGGGTGAEMGGGTAGTGLWVELEATSSTSRTFYIQTATVNWLDELGLDTQLRAMLRRALGEEPGVDIYWRDPLEEKEDEEDRAYF